MHLAFRNAVKEYNFKGSHLGVFPFKVNQRREFIDAIVSVGRDLNYGLEVGSKTEFIAALSYEMSPTALLIANGFKDREFIDLGFIASSMGKNVMLVIEGPDELEYIIDKAKTAKSVPQIGLRIRLYSKGSGKWEKSSGETSKFGLTTTEVLQALQLLENANMQDRLSMLHFHIGSQITAIKRFKNALKEASRVYAKIFKLGFKPKYLNIGGGVGVDYDGSKTTFQSSANYTLQEFANDAVYVLGEVCDNESVPHPTIITESGRVIAAYHSVVVTDIREVQGGETHTFEASDFQIDLDDPNLHKSIKELKFILDNVNRKNFAEFYHDAVEYQEELFTLFNLGYLTLQTRALAEDLFHRIARKALYYSTFQRHMPEEYQTLQKLMVTKYLANFSIFQSIPDAWSIDQLFPVLPLSRHDEKPTQRATIVDITCDSDGCLDRFIDRHGVKTVLDLHAPNEAPYYVGFFLVGAYQESLANEHNLFGAINEVEVLMDETGDWQLAKTTQGDPISELLESRNYSMREIEDSYRAQLKRMVETERMQQDEAEGLLQRLRIYMTSYPYLNERRRPKN
jgi:arginine decarboxylase